jgi:hypothetical protein
MSSTFADVGASAQLGEKSTLPPEQVFYQVRSREEALSRLLVAFICSGMFFMLFPGTLLGVWNLLQISGRASLESISPAWLQAHGHAQVFGWVGSFILGIGFYSIPKMRAGVKSSFVAGWLCWGLWTFGVALRWATNVYRWEWRVLLPVSAVLELGAFFIFFRAVSQHKADGRGSQKLDPWIWVVISASVGLLLVLLTNLAGTFYVSLHELTPAFPHRFDQRYLALIGWGFLVPFVWGFSAKWMTVFLGLKPFRSRLLLAAVVTNLCGLGLVLAGVSAVGTWFFLAAAAISIIALRMFEPSESAPKTRGIHSSFPFFLRMAYAWLLVAASLGVAAVRFDNSGGIWGASRHALTVGFISMMILNVGQRILPAFAGMRQLWGPKLMFAASLLLTIGCVLRVSCEVLAYQGYANWPWKVLPFSALIELTALTVFAVNLLGTFVLQTPHAQCEPMVTRIIKVSV